eukprot:TRINITY_DN6283_c0_g1_i5.p1 TRINITY_DN6283_c0_g1~~TRINITY_DN6283_c0_g1_i5.p1  ORF type:complete len:101 (+),score=9.07 TRINITY_DN6283_c0_g1_i5:202-504(+)
MQGDNYSSSQKELPQKEFQTIQKNSKKVPVSLRPRISTQMISRPFHSANPPEGTVAVSSAGAAAFAGPTLVTGPLIRIPHKTPSFQAQVDTNYPISNLVT